MVGRSGLRMGRVLIKETRSHRIRSYYFTESMGTGFYRYPPIVAYRQVPRSA